MKQMENEMNVNVPLEVIRNLSKIIRRFKTVSFSGKRSLKNPINGGSYGIRNPANSHSIYLLSL